MGIASIFNKRTFSHGIHPADHKHETAGLPVRRMPFPERLILPLDQHIGKPSRPIVKKGQEVVRGEPIAVADGFVSVPMHAPATGVVRGVELMPSVRGPKTQAILIDVYQSSTQQVLWRGEPMDGRATPTEIVQRVRDCGMVGLGGAAFPSHVKLVPAKSAEQEAPSGYVSPFGNIPIPVSQYDVDTLVVNGCECEPYLTCDHRMMLEWTDDLIRGVELAMRALGVKRAIIGVEDNKPDAVAAIQAKLKPDSSISVCAVETKYPQGAEKMLIQSVMGKQVPPGGLPAHIGVVVNNVGTLAMIGRLLPRGEGLIERVITVVGPGVKRPGNYMVPFGATVGFVLAQAGYEGGKNEVILGGPMMGAAVPSLDTPITKGTSGVLVLNETAIGSQAKSWPCIKCGRCLQACPMHLNPSMLGMLAGKRQYDTMATKYNLFDCFECGCCSFVCPSNIPLVQYFRIAKALEREKAK